MNKNQKIALIVVAIVIAAALAFFFLPKSTTAPITTEATSTDAVTAPAGTKGVPAKGTQTGTVASSPSVPLSSLIKKDATSVSLYAGVDPSGRTIYNPVPDADPATFKAITQLAVVEKPTEKANGIVTTIGEGSVAYYKDKNRVYVLSVFETDASTQVAIQVVQETTPATFKTLNSWYAKDANHIYRLTAPTNTNPLTPGTYVWKSYDLEAITNIDVASFVLVTDTSLTYDAHDNSHKYRKGIVVGTYPE